MKAIDVSYWGGIVTQQQAHDMYVAGIRLAVVGAWHGISKNPYCEESLKNCREAGMFVACYIAMNDRLGWTVVRKAQEACGNEWKHVLFVALDCETDGLTEAILWQGINEVEKLNKTAVIYSAAWWWIGSFNNTTTFKGTFLWNANYDNDPDFDFVRYPYGGWSVDSEVIPKHGLIGEQYGNTQPLSGHSVDLDNFIDSWVLSLVGDEMTDEERATLAAAKQEAERRKAQAAVAIVFNNLTHAALQGVKGTETDRVAARWLLSQ